MEECLICLRSLQEPVDYATNTSDVFITACYHKFHRCCLAKWLKNGDPGDSCPICKIPMEWPDILQLFGLNWSDGIHWEVVRDILELIRDFGGMHYLFPERNADKRCRRMVIEARKPPEEKLRQTSQLTDIVLKAIRQATGCRYQCHISNPPEGMVKYLENIANGGIPLYIPFSVTPLPQRAKVYARSQRAIEQQNSKKIVKTRARKYTKRSGNVQAGGSKARKPKIGKGAGKIKTKPLKRCRAKPKAGSQKKKSARKSK